MKIRDLVKYLCCLRRLVAFLICKPSMGFSACFFLFVYLSVDALALLEEM